MAAIHHPTLLRSPGIYKVPGLLLVGRCYSCYTIYQRTIGSLKQVSLGQFPNWVFSNETMFLPF